MKIYLAAPFRAKDQMSVCAAQLRAVGIEVTSRWLEETHHPATQLNELPLAEHRSNAIKDVEDVLAADALVLFTDPTKSLVRQGRTAEFGMAIAINKGVRPMPVFVVGEEYENIFHYLDHVQHFLDWETTKQAVLKFASQFNSKRI